MCGIAGYAGPSRRFDDQKLGAMLRAIEHRGPDDCGVYSAALKGDPRCAVWLGSRRLAIQDLSPAGHQPMIDEATGNVIAFNGEIYNFLELKSQLERAGEQFRSRCDTEAALRSWGSDGVRAVEQWRGMFGAAIWDALSEELWLVRDPWGIKPLYYRYDGEGIAFCSEVRALLEAGVAPRKLCRRGVEDYLEFGAVQDPVTMIEGVYALLPGHTLRWSRGKIEIQRYSHEPAEAAEPGVIEPMLREIVRQQLIADVPVVVFLSGGVDSSVVAAVARQEAGSGVHTMSVVFEEQQFSEREYARRVAERIGTQHQEVTLRASDMQAQAVEAIARMDQPTIDGVNTYVISQAARRAGFTVALSGLGGDEFFGGYSTFFRTARLRKLQTIAAASPALARVTGRALQALAKGPASRLGALLESGDFRRHPYFAQRTVFFQRQIEALCGPRDRAEADQVADQCRKSLLEEASQLDELNQVSFLEARTYMANMLLRDSDQMSMAHSLELRVPLVDHILAARLLATPGVQKGFGKTAKQWLGESFVKYLPDEVFSRKKMGFVLPFAVWLRGPLASQVEKTLLGEAGKLWNRAAVQQVWSDFQQGRLSWSRPWALYVLSRWAAQHLH